MSEQKQTGFRDWSQDNRDPETIKQMEAQHAASQFPPPQRKTPVKQSDFRHQHEWDAAYAGPGRKCKGCGTVMP